MKNTWLLFVLLAFLCIPTQFVNTKTFAVDKYTVMDGEAGVAYAFAMTKDERVQFSDEIKKPTSVTTCSKCNGTKKYKPDGRIEAPCPCGANCQCVGAVRKLNKQIVLITQPRSCQPCKVEELHVVPALKDAGWTFGKGENISVIDLDKPNESGYNLENLAKQLGKENYWSLPTHLLLEDGKIVAKYEGHLNGWGYGKLWAGKVDANGNLLVDQNDINFREYKGKK